MLFAKSSTSFLDLLREIRDKIYHLVLVAKEAISSFTSTVFGSDLGLLKRYLQLVPQILYVCRTITTEALPTLWPELFTFAAQCRIGVNLYDRFIQRSTTLWRTATSL
jgi:hypothetical protein